MKLALMFDGDMDGDDSGDDGDEREQTQTSYLSLCAAASTPWPGVGVTWASSRVLSRAKRLRSSLGSVGVQEGIT